MFAQSAGATIDWKSTAAAIIEVGAVGRKGALCIRPRSRDRSSLAGRLD